jgi:T5orf172 domain
MRAGFVYFAANEHGHIKVGFSIDPVERAQRLHYDATKSPQCETIKLLAQIPGTIELETTLHRQLKQFRVEGTWEWYWSNPGLIELISGLPTVFAEPPLAHSGTYVAICLNPQEKIGTPYDESWDLSSIPEPQFNSEHARRNSAKRKTHSGGKDGRPRTDAPRCACGLMTAKLAAIRKHKCQ